MKFILVNFLMFFWRKFRGFPTNPMRAHPDTYPTAATAGGDPPAAAVASGDCDPPAAAAMPEGTDEESRESFASHASNGYGILGLCDFCWSFSADSTEDSRLWPRERERERGERGKGRKVCVSVCVRE